MAKLIALSDTHNNYPNINIQGTYLVHCGDFESGNNTVEESRIISSTFLGWLSRQKFKYKILVPGNHDSSFWKDRSWFLNEAKNNKVIVLDGTEVVTLDKLRFFGTPYFYTCFKNKELITYIPDLTDFDVLLTHCPPHGVLDFVPNSRENIGSLPLREYINENKVRLHIFGHCHEGFGRVGTYYNVALSGRSKKKTLIASPVAIDYGFLCN